MYSIAMDVGKYRTYGIVERDGEITKEGFQSFLDGIDHATVIVEASSTIDRIVSMLPEHEIRVANPMKVRLISESMKKTDRNDAHILLDLFRKQYMPESYLPSKYICEARNMCRNRNFLIRQRTAVKNRIRDRAYRLGFDFKGYISFAASSNNLTSSSERFQPTELQFSLTCSGFDALGIGKTLLYFE